ncbi:hypothetical protein ACF1A5_33565 [Streptomyces sp. NPDC014864]|uniref:hypothetical protein n=1 Tax=Streptomyces sp. NPDC014864 TaxID=3364924 RepID=UPI00370084B1
MSDDEADSLFVWGEGTVFRRSGGKSMLLNEHAPERTFAAIAALDPDWTPPPPSEPNVEVW